MSELPPLARPRTRTCSSCAAFDPPAKGRDGNCRRSHPTAHAFMGQARVAGMMPPLMTVGAFPPVGPADWCLEWLASTPPVAPVVGPVSAIDEVAP